MKYPLISIIFPNHNGGQEPIDCLNSIAKLNYPKTKLETIVVDNNSTDNSDIKIFNSFPEVHLIKKFENNGFAKSINLGIKIAHGQFIFVANDDLIFEKNSLLNMIKTYRKFPQTGVMGGKIYSKKFKNNIISSVNMMNPWTGNIYLANKYNIDQEPDWIQGCAMLIPKKIFKRIGYFDENYEHFFEDFDFCLRVKKIKYHIIYNPNAIFWHGESLTADKNKPNKYYHWYKSKIRFILINFPVINIVTILIIQIFFITPYRALVLQDGRLLPFIKALIWNMIHIKKTLKFRKK